MDCKGALTRAGPPASSNCTITRQILLHVQAFFQYQPHTPFPPGCCLAPRDGKEKLFCIQPTCFVLACSSILNSKAMLWVPLMFKYFSH